MNKRFLILTLASFICCLLLFIVYPSFKFTNNYPSSFTTNFKGAFITTLSDFDMVEPTLVSLYSLNAAFIKNPTTRSDIIVYVKDVNLDTTQIEQFQKLNANIIFKSKKLDYQKLVYFTPSVLFENNVNELFTYPAGASIYGDHNDILFSILELKEKTSIEAIINQQPHQYMAQDKVKNTIQVFDKSIKPWNFHTYRDNDWKKLYDPIKFYQWRKQSNDMNDYITNNTNTAWTNKPRQSTVCDAYLQSVANINHFPVQDQFSVLISTYNPDRIEHLSLIIRHLLKSTKVHTVYITWHNPDLQVPSTLYDQIKQQDINRIKVLCQSFDSLNNRFNPIDDLQTEAVYILDDDIYIDIKDLEFTFEIWKNRKDSVVGHFPRLHSYDKETHEATYNLIGKAPYSIILTKSMFIRSDYLFSYTCLLEPKLHEYVDQRLNCEDIGFMMMASGTSGIGSTYVRPQKALQDFGLTQGISINNSHMPARSQCVADFITQFWSESDPLITSFETIGNFIKPVIETGDWDNFQE